MKLIIIVILLLTIGVNMPKKSNKDKNKLAGIPSSYQFCYPNYKQKQKGMKISDFRKLFTKQKIKVNPFIYKAPNLNKRLW